MPSLSALVASSLSLVAGLALAAVPAARADTLELADGRVVEGRVTKDADSYRVVSRYGEATIAAKDVKSWTRAKPVDVEWRERLAALKPGDTAARAEIAKWLAEAGRADDAAATAQAVLAEDPDSAGAHAVLGHVRHGGTWMTPDEAKRADGLEEHGGQWYTPAEWALVDGAGKTKASEADRAFASRRVETLANQFIRLMLAPDKALRAEGKKRLLALAKETKTAELERLVPKVEAYAAAADRLAAAYDGGEGSEAASLLAECRIQMATLKRPIQTLATSLGSNLGGGPVIIQLPELEVIKVNTTVKFPAGVR